MAQSNQDPQGTVVPSNQQSAGQTGQASQNPDLKKTPAPRQTVSKPAVQTSTQASTQAGVDVAPQKPVSGPATPQSPGDRALAEKMFGSGRITPDRIRRNCANPVRRGEIIVCAPSDQGQRVDSTATSDPTSNQALHDGRLHTPDVAGSGIFKGKATVSKMCLPTCPPEAAYMIDLKSIPLAPAGSDADKIAKGEMRAP